MASTSSIGHISTDPLRNFKFLVDINHPTIPSLGGTRMGFMSVSGLNITTEFIPYREGGMNTTTQKMPGQSDFAPITLSRGVVVGDPRMLNWMKQLFTVQQGTGQGGSDIDFRANLLIKVLAHPVTVGDAPVKAIFKVYNAWPTAIAFSDLDAGANAILVHQMTLAHEGFDYNLATSIAASSVATLDF